MLKNEYQIVDDFQISNRRVLVLDRDYEFGRFNKAVIDGKYFSYTLNSVRRWIVIESHDCFKGKTIIFVNESNEIHEAIAV